ncbi:peptidoglycan-binding domain-containing protein [Streptomyces nojiriensis]|uniref:peptidoglycan-binding domain-containing protein n=1 Tax=Streptomyces nojiriensis TaxID=66374 RepID=UPI0035E28DC2
MPQISPRRTLTALALAAAAVGSLLVTAPAAQANDYLGACLDSVGYRKSPNGWNVPARNFSQGSSGVCVKELQLDLASTIGIDEEDWPGFVDGRFGPKTDKYVRRFQQSSHLEVDGIVGPRTWESLISRTTD